MTDHHDPLLDVIQRELATWHSTHPTATLAAIEAAVEERLGRLRASLIHETIAGRPIDDHPQCPSCGTTMQPRTTETRTLILRGDQPLSLERAYVVCPACGVGFFPPG